MAKKRGRPKKIDNDKLRKIKEAFAFGCSDREACIYADIAESTFYDFCAINEDFSEEKKRLKLNPILKAKKTVFDNLDDIKIAQWYLERKCSDEFSTSQKTENVNLNTEVKAVDRKTISEAIKKIKELQE